MRSARLGKNTSSVEVTNIGPHGFWLFLDGRELYLPFDRFPWFREASIRKVVNVERPFLHHLHWPDLDIDLEVESIESPERYPLVSRLLPGVKRQGAGNRGKRLVKHGQVPVARNKTRSPKTR